MDGQVRDNIKTSFALNYPTLHALPSVPVSNLVAIFLVMIHDTVCTKINQHPIYINTNQLIACNIYLYIKNI